MIVQYQHQLIIGRPLLYYDPDFKPGLDLFAGFLEQTRVRLIVMRSFAVQNVVVPGAIVTPAKRSNHLVACGFDGNFIDGTGKYWSSKELEDLSGDVLALITLVRASGVLRWGGDFHTPDGVHFDNALNIKNPGRWLEIYNELHPAPVLPVTP